MIKHLGYRWKFLHIEGYPERFTVFEDNDLLFWMPDVLCQHSEVVLWNLLSIEMFFWWICEGESGLPVLFLHLRTASYFQFSSQGVFQNHESDFKIMSQIISLHWAQYAGDFPSTQSKSQSPYNGLWGPLCYAACNFSLHPLLPLLISPNISFFHEHSCSPLSCSTFLFNLGFITSKIIFNLLICIVYWL